MTANEEELVSRYIYQVTRRLPRGQREEVGLELQELISDMAERGKPVGEVLAELGDPAEFAKKYRDDAHYLIGPEYFDTYLWFVKLVLICTLIPILVVSSLDGIRELISGAEGDRLELVASGLARVISSVLTAAVSAFGAVTLTFAVMERRRVKLDLREEKAWSVNDLGALSPVPDKRAVIDRSDSIVSIVFIVIFCVLLIFAPHFFSAVFRDDGTVVTIPVFNLAQWNVILPVFIISLLIGLTDEILRLVVGFCCRAVMISSIVSGGLQILLSFVVLKVFPFWNPDFAEQVGLRLGEQLDGPAELLLHWDGSTVSNIILAIIVVATAAEIGTTVYKTLRYGADAYSYPQK